MAAPTPLPTPLAAPIIHPSRGRLPVLLSVPHSGRDYPDWLVAMASGGRTPLVALEDPLVDRLVWRAVQRGAAAVIARAPRAAVDCNRAEDDVDPAVIEGGYRGRVSARARGGLGIVPGRTQKHGYLWRRPIGATQLEDRLAQAHRPYHQALEQQLDALVERFGCALLLDCHSMPPPARGVPEIVIGDCHGRSAAPLGKHRGCQAGAGGGLCRRAQRPVCRRPHHRAPWRAGPRRPRAPGRSRPPLLSRRRPAAAGPGFDRVAALFETLAAGLGDLLLGREFATAAE